MAILASPEDGKVTGARWEQLATLLVATRKITKDSLRCPKRLRVGDIWRRLDLILRLPSLTPQYTTLVYTGL